MRTLPTLRSRFGDMPAFRSDFGRFFDDFWQDFEVPGPAAQAAQFWPSVDISETDGAFVIETELPGLDPKDVDIQVEDDRLLIKGEKSTHTEKMDKDYSVRERSFGSFQRSFRLPKNIDLEKIAADFNNGLLVITLPKAEEPKRKIQIKAA